MSVIGHDLLLIGLIVLVVPVVSLLVGSYHSAHYLIAKRKPHAGDDPPPWEAHRRRSRRAGRVALVSLVPAALLLLGAFSFILLGA